jgi:hypothetical protein
LHALERFACSITDRIRMFAINRPPPGHHMFRRPSPGIGFVTGMFAEIASEFYAHYPESDAGHCGNGTKFAETCIRILFSII